MAEEVEAWIKVGKFEHCLPAANFGACGQDFDGNKLTAEDLEFLFKNGSRQVRKAEKEPAKTASKT